MKTKDGIPLLVEGLMASKTFANSLSQGKRLRTERDNKRTTLSSLELPHPLLSSPVILLLTQSTALKTRVFCTSQVTSDPSLYLKQNLSSTTLVTAITMLQVLR